MMEARAKAHGIVAETLVLGGPTTPILMYLHTFEGGPFELIVAMAG